MYESGAVYDPKVLDLKDEDLLKAFQAGVCNIAAISLQVDYPTLASVPHSIINGYKKVLAVAIATDYSFPRAEKIKDMIANPDKYASAAPAASAAAAAPAAGAAKEEKKAAKVRWRHWCCAVSADARVRISLSRWSRRFASVCHPFHVPFTMLAPRRVP